jgi:hypothetical protein
MPKLSSACFAMTVTSLMNTETLKLIYFAKYFTSKKRIRMAAAKRKASCSKLHNKFNILPLASKFLLSLLSFTADDMENFKLIQISTL